MSNITEVSGDLLEMDTQYIAHQCNCVTTQGKGLSASLFKRFPWADTYTGRSQPSTPGSIQVFGDGVAKRFVINMFAQYNPGKPRPVKDTAHQRQKWFADCLQQIGALPDLQEVAFPYLIGCGLAGGNWEVYLRLLEEFADTHIKHRVILVRKQ